MRVLLLINPKSFHTQGWLLAYQNRGFEVEILYVGDWVENAGSHAAMPSCPIHLVSLPTTSRLMIESLKGNKLGLIIRDLTHRTLFHQEMQFIGKHVAMILRANEFDLIHAHQMHTMGIVSGLVGFHPTVVSTWGSDVLVAPNKYPYYDYLYREAIRNADLIQTSSAVSKRRILGIYPKPEEDIFVSSWGVDCSFFRPNIDARQIRKKFNISDGINLLSFRALEPLYRIDKIIRAFNILEKEFEDLTLLIGQDGSLRSSLENLCQKLGIKERVRFIGTILGKQMAQLFGASDIYVQCPLSDGVSVSAMQALASGLPIVANPVGETESVLIDGYNGLFVGNDNPEDYSQAIKKILKDNALRQKMSKNSRKLAEKKHNRHKFLNSFFDKIPGFEQ